VARRPLSSLRRSFPKTMGYREVLWRRAVQEQRWTSGGIHRQERWELLQAVKQGCEALPHRLQGIIIKQRPHALPPQPLAAAFCPDGSEPRTAPLWRLVDHKRPPPHQGKPHGELLLAMAVGVLTVVALIFQGIARLIVNLPPRTATSHQAIHSALAHPQVCYPAQVLGLPMASLPIRNTIDPHVRVRGIERHLVDQAQPLPHPSGAVMALILRDAPSVLGCLPLGEEMGMIAFCDTENIMPPRRVQGLDVGGMGTPTVVGDDAREMGVIVAERGDAAVGRLPCTIVLARAIVGHHGFGQQWHHCAPGWMDHGCAQHLMVVGDRPMTVDCVQP